MEITDETYGMMQRMLDCVLESDWLVAHFFAILVKQQLNGEYKKRSPKQFGKLKIDREKMRTMVWVLDRKGDSDVIVNLENIEDGNVIAYIEPESPNKPKYMVGSGIVKID